MHNPLKILMMLIYRLFFFFPLKNLPIFPAFFSFLLSAYFSQIFPSKIYLGLVYVVKPQECNFVPLTSLKAISRVTKAHTTSVKVIALVRVHS